MGRSIYLMLATVCFFVTPSALKQKYNVRQHFRYYGPRPIKPSCDLKCQQKKAAAEIMDLYNNTRKIIGNLFAITFEETNSFQDFAAKEIREQQTVCQPRKIDRFTQCKIEELKEIQKNNPCNSRPINSTRVSADDWYNYVDDIDDAARVDNSNVDGPVVQRKTTLRNCYKKGELTENNDLRLCASCSAESTFPENVFPRYLNEAICDPRSTRCFGDEGNCRQTFLYLDFRYDDKGVGMNKLGDWKEIRIKIRTSCLCQARADSLVLRDWI